MKIRITPHPLEGEIAAISSKSAVHRELICAALSSRRSKVACNAISEDIHATIQCLEALGAKINESDGYISVVPIDKNNLPQNPVMDAGASGSTLRFIVPIVAALGCGAEVHMTERLSHRPMQALLESLSAHGAEYKWIDNQVLKVYPNNGLTGGEYCIPGNQSSQYISGLMFMMPLVAQDPEPYISVDGHFESRGYVEMTRSVLERAGIDMVSQYRSRGLIEIGFSGDPKYRRYDAPDIQSTEGDWSNAAFWIAASILSGRKKISITGLSEQSKQGDASIERVARDVIVPARGGARIIDVRNIPDLMPVLSVLAASASDETMFTGGTRLRIKETDRLETTSTMLRSFGVDVEITNDKLTVKGRGGTLSGNCTIDSCDDHRIAMSAAIAAIICDGPVVIERAEAVAKSYPGFWEDYAKLGGQIEFIG